MSKTLSFSSSSSRRLRDIPLSLTLGSNEYVFEDGQWYLTGSDLEEAENEITSLIEDKKGLKQSLELAREQSIQLKQAVIDSDRAKKVAMDMLAEEHQRRVTIEAQLDGYKTELRKSYKVIIELRKMLNQSTSAVR